MDPTPLPGLRRLRRGPRTWQYGLDATAATRVSSPALADLPEHLRVDRDALPRTRLTGPGRAAVVQRGVSRAADRLCGRERARVRVVGDLGVDPAALLEAGGILTGDGVVLLLSDGETDRDLLDRLVADSVPHLVVRLVDGVVTIGPFVVPGVTACLRCVDLHLSVDDPVYPALIAQHTAAPHLAEADGWPAPRDLPLLTLATAWAVRDLCTFAEGDRPTTWSATVRLEAGLASLAEVHWLRHPGCACFWLTEVEGVRTMAP